MDEIVHCFKNVCVVRMSSGKVHRQLVRQIITSTAIGSSLEFLSIYEPVKL